MILLHSLSGGGELVFTTRSDSVVIIRSIPRAVSNIFGDSVEIRHGSDRSQQDPFPPYDTHTPQPRHVHAPSVSVPTCSSATTRRIFLRPTRQTKLWKGETERCYSPTLSVNSEREGEWQ
jgi:hypothetical protein